MNKKIFSYILLVFVVLFGLNNKVDALTCIYSGTGGLNPFTNTDAIKLVQLDDTILVYRDNKNDNPGYDSKSWKVYNNATIYSDRTDYSKNKTFDSCPAYASYNIGGSTFWFYDDTNYHLDSKHPLISNSADDVGVLESVVIKDADRYINYDSSFFQKSCDVTSLKNGKWLIERDKETYDISCLYYYSNVNGCSILQLDFSSNKMRISSSYLMNGIPVGYDFDSSKILELYGNQCPINIYYKDEDYKCSDGIGCAVTREDLSLTGDYSSRYSLVRSTAQIKDIDLIYEEVKIDSCEDLLSEELVSYLNFGITAVKIVVPLILIVLGVVDFARGVFSSEDDMKKIQQKFIKRVILAVGFFLIPTIIGVFLDIAGNVFGINTDFCGLAL